MGKSLKGRNLGKGISQRKDGRYQARFTDRFGNRKVLYNPDLAQLRKELQKAQVMDFTEKSVREELTMEEWFNIWIATYKKNCARNTIDFNTAAFNKVPESVRSKKLTQIDPSTLQVVFNGYNGSTSARVRRVLSDMFRMAVLNQVLSRNPMELVVFPKATFKKEGRVLTREEEYELREALRGSLYLPITVLILNTGMRIGEVLGLMWQDIDFKRRTINSIDG